MPPTLSSQVEYMAKCAGTHLQGGVFDDRVCLNFQPTAYLARMFLD